MIYDTNITATESAIHITKDDRPLSISLQPTNITNVFSKKYLKILFKFKDNSINTWRMDKMLLFSNIIIS